MENFMTVDQVGCFRVHVGMELQTQLDSSLQDSLTLLHVLLELQRRSPVKFTVAAATVNPETPEFAPEPLIDTWCKSLAGANSDSTGIVAVWCLMPFAVWRTLRFPCHALNRLLARVEIAHFLTWSNCISWFMVSPTLCSDLLDMHDEIVLNDTLWEQILCVHAQFTKAKHGKTTVRGF